MGDLTVTQAADLLDIGRPAFSRVLNGRASLSIALAFQFEWRCGLDARRLLHEQLDAQIADFINQEKWL